MSDDIIEDELNDFFDRLEVQKNLKLFVDFEASKMEVPKKQIEIEGIKYKKIIQKRGGTFNKNKKPKQNNSLF